MKTGGLDRAVATSRTGGRMDQFIFRRFSVTEGKYYIMCVRQIMENTRYRYLRRN